MMIWIADSFNGLDFAEDAIGREAIEAACCAAGRGQHYVFGARGLLKSIAQSAALSITAKGVLDSIIAEYSFLAALVQRLTYRIDMERDLGVVERRGETHWAVPARHIADHGVRPTVLLAENTRDAEIYINAARHFQISDALPPEVQICVEPRNGNGNGISRELSLISRRPAEWCLCVTDSDIEFPGGAFGDIAKACSNMIQDQAHAVTRHVATTGRELENEIPIKLFAAVVERTHADEWRHYVQCERRVGSEALQYADLKSGIALCRLLSKPDTAPERIFWLARVRRDRGAQNCLVDQECDHSGRIDCIIVRGFGERTAEHVQEIMNGDSVRRVFRTAQASSNFDAWLRLGKEVFFAGAAPKRIRI